MARTKFSVVAALLVSAHQVIGLAPAAAQRTQSIESILENVAAPSVAVWLELADGKIPAIYKEEQTGMKQGAAVVVHDLGMNPDWPEVVTPLRNGLPTVGWTTLSISPPALQGNVVPADMDALQKATAEALESALKYLGARGYENVALIGVGLGATVSAAFLANSPGHGVDAFIGINMAPFPATAPTLTPAVYLEKIALPILDLYGERAAAGVRADSAARALAAKKSGAAARADQNIDPFKRSAVAQSPFDDKTGFIAYRQIVVPGANPAFVGQEEILVKRIVGWLRRHATGVTVQR